MAGSNGNTVVIRFAIELPPGIQGVQVQPVLEPDSTAAPPAPHGRDIVHVPLTQGAHPVLVRVANGVRYLQARGEFQGTPAKYVFARVYSGWAFDPHRFPEMPPDGTRWVSVRPNGTWTFEGGDEVEIPGVSASPDGSGDQAKNTLLLWYDHGDRQPPTRKLIQFWAKSNEPIVELVPPPAPSVSVPPVTPAAPASSEAAEPSAQAPSPAAEASSEPPPAASPAVPAATTEHHDAEHHDAAAHRHGHWKMRTEGFGTGHALQPFHKNQVLIPATEEAEPRHWHNEGDGETHLRVDLEAPAEESGDWSLTMHMGGLSVRFTRSSAEWTPHSRNEFWNIAESKGIQLKDLGKVSLTPMSG